MYCKFNKGQIQDALLGCNHTRAISSKFMIIPENEGNGIIIRLLFALHNFPHGNLLGPTAVEPDGCWVAV